MPRLSLSVSMVCMVLTLMIIPPTSGKSLGAAGLVIGTTKITIDHAWRRDGGPCVGGICGYKTWFQKGLWVEVSYNKQNRADGYQFDFDPDLYLGQPLSPAPQAYWKYLVSFLPSDARRTTCKYFAKTGGLMGPAYACIYAYGKQQILVAHWLTADGNLDLGWVNLGYNFDYIAAAK